MNFKGVAFEGGGVCGLGHVGVIKYLAQIKLYDKLTHFAGSSAGSMVAGMAACRVSPADIEAIMLALDFKGFEDNSWFVFLDIYRLTNQFGWNPGDSIKKIYSAILEKYVGDGGITFARVKAKFGTTLVVTATDFCAGSTIYYTPETAPDMAIAEAVHRSAAFPLFFCPIVESGKLLIDGGTLNNYPIRKLYDYLPEDQVIGSKLITDDDLRVAKPLPKNLLEYIKTLVEILHNQNIKLHVHSEDWARTIKVDIGTVSVLDFNLSEESKRVLIGAGENGAKTFFT